jgi:hypothetical protein
MAFQPESRQSGAPDAPTVDAVQADMGDLRRVYWLAAALRHLGNAALAQDAEDVLQKFITDNVPAVCKNYTPLKGPFESYLWNSFKYCCRQSAEQGRP